MIPVVGFARHLQTRWSARYMRHLPMPAERRGRHRPIEPVSASNGGRERSPAVTVPATAQHAKESYCLPPLQVADCVDHIREPVQFTGKALAQLCRGFPSLANIEKAAAAVNGDIHPAVGVEIHGKFTDGGIRQCQDTLHAARGQDAKGCRFIVAAQIEAFVEDLAACFDSLGAEQLIQPFSRPDGQPCRKFLSQLTQHPLTGVDRLLVFFPQARFLPLDLVDLRYAKCNPPFRSRENVEQLWQYVFDGTIDTIGSDHGPYTDEEKTQQGDFWKELCGFGGYDALLAGLLTEGVHRRGLSLPTLSKITASNVAEIMHLAPKKGSLMPGCDADILVVDLNREWTFDGTRSFSKTKSIHNIYHGMQMKGKVLQTYVRGQLVYDEGKFFVQEGYGKYIPRQHV